VWVQSRLSKILYRHTYMQAYTYNYIYTQTYTHMHTHKHFACSNICLLMYVCMCYYILYGFITLRYIYMCIIHTYKQIYIYKSRKNCLLTKSYKKGTKFSIQQKCFPFSYFLYKINKFERSDLTYYHYLIYTKPEILYKNRKK